MLYQAQYGKSHETGFVNTRLSGFMSLSLSSLSFFTCSSTCSLPCSVYSPIWTAIVSYVVVCNVVYMSYKTHGFGWRFIHCGEASFVIYDLGNALLMWPVA